MGMPASMAHVDGRKRGAPIHRRQPAGIAMGQHVQRSVAARGFCSACAGAARRVRARRCGGRPRRPRRRSSAAFATRLGAVGRAGGCADRIASSRFSAQRKFTAVGRVAASSSCARRVPRRVGRRAWPARCRTPPWRRSAARRARSCRDGARGISIDNGESHISKRCGRRVWSMISTVPSPASHMVR